MKFLFFRQNNLVFYSFHLFQVSNIKFYLSRVTFQFQFEQIFFINSHIALFYSMLYFKAYYKIIL